MVQILIFLPFIFYSISSVNCQIEWKIPLEYATRDDYRVLGNIQIRKGFDGNYTGEFTPISEEMKYLRKVIAGGSDQQIRMRSGNAMSTNFANHFTADSAYLIELAVDQNTQKVLSVTHRPIRKAHSATFALPVYVRINAVQELSGPDTATYLHRLEEEKRARQHGAGQDNRSFLQKYWMYFVPVILFMVLSNVFNADQPGQE